MPTIIVSGSFRENGSDQYYRHNKGLLFDDRQKMLLGQMEEVENILNNGM